MTSVTVRPDAAADIEAAYQWYESQATGLGDQFLDVVGEQLHSLESHPEQFPIIHRNTRRALLRRFPYQLFYRLEANVIIVVACLHGRRHPRRWKMRP